MMAGGLREKTRAMFNPATFWIRRREIEATQPREGNRRRAHGAWLQRHMDIAAGEPFGIFGAACPANRQDLRVSGRILVPQGLIAGARNDRPIAHDHGANWHLAALHGGACFEKSARHGIGVQVMHRLMFLHGRALASERARPRGTWQPLRPSRGRLHGFEKRLRKVLLPEWLLQNGVPPIFFRDSLYSIAGCKQERNFAELE